MPNDGPADENFLNLIYPPRERLVFARGESEHHHWIWRDPELWRSFEDRLPVYHFSGCIKPWNPLSVCKEPFTKFCQEWKEQEKRFVNNTVPDYHWAECRE